jgi:TolB protein
MTPSDEELVRRCLDGERDAFALLARRHQRRVYALALSKVPNLQDAEDVVQETFEKAYANLWALRQPDRFVGWIARIALRCAADWHRGRKETVTDVEELLKDVPDPSPGFAAFERREDTRRIYEDVWRTLSDEERQVFYLHEIAELTTAEIAETLMIRPETVEKRRVRARVKVRERYERLGRLDEVLALVRSYGLTAAAGTEFLDGILNRIPSSPPKPPTARGTELAKIGAAATFLVALGLAGVVAWTNAVSGRLSARPVEQVISVEMTGWDAPGSGRLAFVLKESSAGINVAGRAGAPESPDIGGLPALSGMLGATTLLYAAGDERTAADIYAVSADGASRKQLTRDSRVNGGAAWSPDGTRIAFASNRTGATELWVMNGDGSDQRQVTWRGDGGVEFPAWSPDGNRIAFVSRIGENRRNQEIFSVNADGTDLQRLTDYDAADACPAWSPDGETIAFVSCRHHPFDGKGGSSRTNKAGPNDLYLMNADGTNIRRLAYLDESAYSPSWSPDGKRIAWAAGTGGGNMTEIYVIDSDGTNLRRLTRNEFADNGPRWSPDGTKIAFWSNRHAWNAAGQAHSELVPATSDLYAMDVDGTNVERMTFNSQTIADMSLSWSPLPNKRLSDRERLWVKR